MDVTTFMATICPIAARGGAADRARPRRRVRDERDRLDVHADPHAHERDHRAGAARLRAEDDPDRHDRDRAAGAAGARRRVVVPAARRGRSTAARPPGSRSSIGGLLAFVVAAPARRASTRSRSRDEVRGGRHAVVGGLAELARGRLVASRASASSAKTSTGASSSRAGGLEQRARAAPRVRRPSAASSAASRQSPSAACSPPPASRWNAAAASSAARASAVRPSARSTRPRWTRPSAASRTSPVASALRDPELQRRRARPRSRRPGTAPGRGS